MRRLCSWLESLEERRLLTATVIQATPTPYTNSAELATNISIRFDGELDPTSVSSESMVVRSQIRGLLAGEIVVNGDTIRFSPNDPLHAGEPITVVVTADIVARPPDSTEFGPIQPYTFHFEGMTLGGIGKFHTDGQGFGRFSSVGDVDGDGDIDIVGERVLFNDGDGQFTQGTQSLLIVPHKLTDIDNDGDLDLVSNRGTQLNDGSGKFGDISQEFPESVHLLSCVDDLDADGDVDVILSETVDDIAKNRIWLNDGNGTLEPTDTLLPSGPVQAYDLTRDGKLDLLIDGTLFVGNANAYVDAELPGLENITGRLTIADFTKAGDGFTGAPGPELISYPANSNHAVDKVRVAPLGVLDSLPLVLSSDSNAISEEFLARDFNGDGRAEVFGKIHSLGHCHSVIHRLIATRWQLFPNTQSDILL